MTVTERVLEQGKARVRAIEALETIQATGALERAMVWLLVRACRSGVMGRACGRAKIQA
jgi:hypothetical protein